MWAACVVALGVVFGTLACSGGVAEPPDRLNVVLVVLDAARADHFGSYGYARDTTPRADAFATRATRYETVISEAPFTFLATSSLFAAASPAASGLAGRAGGIASQDLELISETARESGFATFAYSENPYVTHDFGLDQGFDVFEEAFPVSDYRTRRDLDPEIDSAARLASMLARAAAEKHRPFFLYAHLLRPHNPYAPPPPYAGRFGSSREDAKFGETQTLVAMDRTGGPFERDEIDRVERLYDENLAFADGLFGGLLADLEERGLRGRTIVILTSDHGEAFGEHGRMLHSSQLYDSMLRIPLIVDVPGATGGVRQTPIQLADLGRGLRAYFQGERGAAARLTRLGEYRDEGEPLYSWTNASTHLVAARTERRKLVIDATTFGVVAYHDLSADPGERRVVQLDQEAQEMYPGLARKIAEWVGVAVETEATPEIDTARRSQLEALGYLDSD